jgi:hypothetical protein
MTATPLAPPRAPRGATTLGAIRRAHHHGTATGAPPRPIVVGQALPTLRQPVAFDHLDAADVLSITSGTWIKPGAGLDHEAARLDELFEQARTTLAAFRNVERDLRTEAKRRALQPEASAGASIRSSWPPTARRPPSAPSWPSCATPTSCWAPCARRSTSATTASRAPAWRRALAPTPCARSSPRPRRRRASWRPRTAG